MAMSMEEVQALVQQMQAKKRVMPKSPPVTRSEGLYLQYMLRSKGSSCADVARAVGVGKATVCNVVNGKNAVSA